MTFSCGINVGRSGAVPNGGRLYHPVAAVYHRGTLPFHVNPAGSTFMIRNAARPRMTRGGLLAGPVLASLFVFGLAGPAKGEKKGSEDQPATGRELFARQWVPGDSRSHGGDGLGPVYNERSCLGCHHQGGPGGAAGADKNIEILSATGEPFLDSGAFYAFTMSFGGGGFAYRIGPGATGARARPKPPGPAELAPIHPGFRDAPGVVLHRYGPDADYRTWRSGIPGRHGTIEIKTSQRNPTPLFGLGLIDAVPDAVLEAGAKRRSTAWPQVKGRVSRLADGRAGKFGWKAQTATLEEFVLSAAAIELGLEVPGRHEASDPRIPPLDAPGLDLDQAECDALTAYVRGLSAPKARPTPNPHDAPLIKAGSALFKSAGCAACHVPKLGAIEGIYSDLLLHDMSVRLGDTSVYGAFGRSAPEAGPAPAPLATDGRKPRLGASVQEWRTPPLWGVADSAPYLHDGRATTIEEAIRLHGGQATASAQRYSQLSARERRQIEAFLLSLAAPGGSPEQAGFAAAPSP